MWSSPTRYGSKRSPAAVCDSGPRIPNGVPPAAKRRRFGTSISTGKPSVSV